MKKLFIFPSFRLTAGLLLILSLASCGQATPPAPTPEGATIELNEAASQASASQASGNSEAANSSPNENSGSAETSAEQVLETSESKVLEPETSEPETLAISAYSFDELAAAGQGGGCGMTLLAPGTNYQEAGIYFFRGMTATTASEPGYLKLNDKIMPLILTASSGKSFYGQQTYQTFTSQDGTTTLQVNVTLGEPGEIESVEIAAGTLTVQSQGQTVSLAVVGDAGC